METLSFIGALVLAILGVAAASYGFQTKMLDTAERAWPYYLLSAFLYLLAVLLYTLSGREVLWLGLGLIGATLGTYLGARWNRP